MNKKLNNLHQILNETSFKKMEFNEMNKKNVMKEVQGKKSPIIRFWQKNAFSIFAVALLFVVFAATVSYDFGKETDSSKKNGTGKNEKFSKEIKNDDSPKKIDEEKDNQKTIYKVVPNTSNPTGFAYGNFLMDRNLDAEKVIRQFDEFLNKGDRNAAMGLMDPIVLIKSDIGFHLKIKNDNEHPIKLYDFKDVTNTYAFIYKDTSYLKEFKIVKAYYIRVNFYEGILNLEPSYQMVKKIVVVGKRADSNDYKILAFDEPKEEFSRFSRNGDDSINREDTYEFVNSFDEYQIFYSDVPEFSLKKEEQTLYNDLKQNYDLNKLKNVDPITVAKFYIQAGMDGKYELQYDLMDDRPDSILWTKEEHLSQIQKDMSGLFPPTDRMNYDTRIMESHLFEGEFIDHNDGTGHIMYDSPTNVVGFKMAKNDQGVWQVCFLAKQ